MPDMMLTTIETCFQDLADPRVTGRCDHKLVEMIVIVVCGVICGADGWTGIETFGRAKESWLRQFLSLENGIPTHDTFGRVFASLNAEAFQAGFARWVEAVFRVTKGQVIAIDGKTLRRSHDQTLGKEAIHMVSAWASQTGIVLGQRKVSTKSNEITAIPELLRLLDVSGCLITIDALGCQKKIAQAIRDAKADYVLQVKDNQARLRQDLEDWFAYGDQKAFDKMTMDYAEQVHKTSGRVEIRRCWVVADPVAFESIHHYDGWVDLQTIIRVQRETHLPDHTRRETSYYISSLALDASRLLAATQHHWSIENSFHWVLDVTFREDDSRIRLGDSPQNMAVFRHFALNLLKRDPSKSSLKQKRFRAGLDDAYLLRLLTHI